MSQNRFDENHRFIIENYGKQTTFASFLPGISGVLGIPIWSFYVNRGQAICSFGTNNKQNSIVEFFPAHASYQLAGTYGFRTFLKVDGVFYEAFSSRVKYETKMAIGTNELEIEEVNTDLSIKVKVTYFTLPEEKVGGLIRRVSIINLSDKERHIEMLDGLPAIMPYGADLDGYKKTGQTLKAWFMVEDAKENTPYYKVRFSTADSTSVSTVEQGNYYVSFDEAGNKLPMICDPEVVFAYDNSLREPISFMEKSIEELMGIEQMFQNQVPCGFSVVDEVLKDQISINSQIGLAENKEILNTYLSKDLSAKYFEEKLERARDLTDEVSACIQSKTANPVFDAYSQQTYIDNVLRGGAPVELGEGNIFYVYSRKHGDIERDYNDFQVTPENYSQGNGNFRDVNQNRRSDVSFHPFVGTENIKLFYNLLQLDGYNPLQIQTVAYEVTDVEAILAYVDDNDKEGMRAYLQDEFAPGSLLMYVEKNQIALKVSKDEFLAHAVSNSKKMNHANFGEGFWIDHWTYNQDLIDNYLSIFPEKEEEMLFDDNTYTYYESHKHVLPRKDRYEVTDHGVRQYRSLEDNATSHGGKFAMTKHGKGEIYYTNLAAKMMTLTINKMSALDMEGIGIEMEAGKPGWYDALNGLPGIFGSSNCETYELHRMITYLIRVFETYNREISLPIEVANLMKELELTIESYGYQNAFAIWNAFNEAKESYRASVIEGIDGEEISLDADEIVKILNVYLAYLNIGIKASVNPETGICDTYYYHEITDYEIVADTVVIRDFITHPLPLYLEGPVRYLKLPVEKEEKESFYQKVKASDLYDKKLSMYKVNASLKDTTFEVGRCRAFTPGWLENESIWLHMEYKYLLELLRSGLYKEYFDDMKKTVIPFLDYKTYGRSLLENSSFIASSANPDEKIHGKGFVARLSGSTAEFLSMWQIMMIGEKPFHYENGKLSIVFEPALPEDLIPENRVVSATFLGVHPLDYHMDNMEDVIPGEYTVGKIKVTLNDGNVSVFEGAIDSDMAIKLRSEKGCHIEVEIHN